MCIAAPLAQAGLNVAIFGRASDHGALDCCHFYRTASDWHLADIHQVLPPCVSAHPPAG